MKRILCITLILILACSSFALGAVTMTSINVSPNTARVCVNGKLVTTDNFNYNGTLYVPLRSGFETAGATVTWDNVHKQAGIKVPTTDYLFMRFIRVERCSKFALDYLYKDFATYKDAYLSLVKEEADVLSKDMVYIGTVDEYDIDKRISDCMTTSMNISSKYMKGEISATEAGRLELANYTELQKIKTELDNRVLQRYLRDPNAQYYW